MNIVVPLLLALSAQGPSSGPTPRTGAENRPESGQEDLLLASLGDDSVVLTDGRVLRGTVIRDGERTLLKLPHGTLELPARRIAEVLIDPGREYVPRNAKEERWLEEGFVYFERAWMPSERRDRILQARRAEQGRLLEELQQRADFGNAWMQETPHFRVRSNTSPELLAHYADLLERFYEEFDDRWRLRGPREKPEVRIYRDRTQYLDSGAPPSSAGTFHHLDGVLSFHHDSSDREATLDVLFHEGTHLLLHLLRPSFRFPVWLDEGLAEYYGSARPVEGGIEFGGVQEGRLAVLRRAIESGRHLPLDAVLTAPRERFGSLHYAEAWSFVHWLQHHRRHAARFKAFFRQLAAGRGLKEHSIEIAGQSRRAVDLDEVRDLLLRHLRVRDLASLEEDWLRYVREELPEPGPRGWVFAGKLHYRDRQLRKAREALHRAIELGSEDPTARWTLMRVHRILEDWEAYVAAFESGAEIDPLDAAMHHEFGLGLVEERTVPDELRELGRRHLFLAAELEPAEPRFRQALDRQR